MAPPPTDTIAALATPVGTSALAVIRVSGGEAARLALELSGSPPPARRARVRDYRTTTGDLLDEAVFTFFPAPRSYTGEHVLELSCHGNPYLVQRILEDLFSRGCRPAQPGEFTRRAFLNGRMDLSQAEAVMDVIAARSERALAAAQRQLRGALGRRMEALIGALIRALATVEAYIDFPDEDLPPEDGAATRAAIDAALADCAGLLATQHYGELMRDGLKTVIIGESNAGKSSLLNRLLGRDRAIVSPEPGTTRDFLEERLIDGPHCLRLVDTAGLNPDPGPVERLGIEKTLLCIEESDIIVLVLDATRPSPALPPAVARRLGPGRAVAALNKADLLSGAPAAAAPAGLAAVPVSALTGYGIDTLNTEILRLADGLAPLADENAVAINARHAHALAQAGDCLRRALRNLASRGPAELLASDLRGALEALGEISGKVDNERMLDELFASFCIGK